jgi:hypothetical protein
VAGRESVGEPDAARCVAEQRELGGRGEFYFAMSQSYFTATEPTWAACERRSRTPQPASTTCEEHGTAAVHAAIKRHKTAATPTSKRSLSDLNAPAAVTAAALVFAVAFGRLPPLEIIIRRNSAVGAAAAALIDARIRALVVPALMQLLGRWRWWAPAPLDRLHGRLRLGEVARPRPGRVSPKRGARAVSADPNGVSPR